MIVDISFVCIVRTYMIIIIVNVKLIGTEHTCRTMYVEKIKQSVITVNYCVYVLTVYVCMCVQCVYYCIKYNIHVVKLVQNIQYIACTTSY